MHTDSAAAITEFRELSRSRRTFQSAISCLANALYNVGRLSEAKTEYQTVMTSDPANPVPHRGLGLILESQREYDAALVEYGNLKRLTIPPVSRSVLRGVYCSFKKDFRRRHHRAQTRRGARSVELEHHAHHGEALERHWRS